MQYSEINTDIPALAVLAMGRQHTLILLLFFLASFYDHAKAQESCCPLKSVAGISYQLLGEDQAKTTMHGCKDGCVYKREDDMSNPPEEVCFKVGENTDVQCIEEPIHIGGCIGAVYYELIYSIPPSIKAQMRGIQKIGFHFLKTLVTTYVGLPVPGINVENLKRILE